MLQLTVDLAERPEWKWLLADSPPPAYCLTFLQNLWVVDRGSHGGNFLAPTWSLCVEEQFYLLLPILIRKLTLRQLTWVMGGTFVSALMIKWLILRSGLPAVAIWVLLPARLDAFMVGAAVAVIVRNSDFRASHAGRFLGLAVAAVVVGVFALLTLVPGRDALLGYGGASLLAGTFGVLVWWASVAQTGIMIRVLEFKPLRWLGTISYLAYLIHQPINGGLHALFLKQSPRIGSLPELGLTVAALCATLLLCWLSWQYFESPMIHLGRRLTQVKGGAVDVQQKHS